MHAGLQKQQLFSKYYMLVQIRMYVLYAYACLHVMSVISRKYYLS